MTDTTITVAAPEAETAPAEITLAIATGIALAEAERAGEEADELTEEVETLAGEVEAATEIASEAIASSRSTEEELSWLRDHVHSLEDRLQSLLTPTVAETTEALLILPNSEDQTDPATLTPEPETPLSDTSPMDDPASDAPPLEVAAVLAQPRRKRRLLI